MQLFDTHVCDEMRDRHERELAGIEKQEPGRCAGDPHFARMRTWGRATTRLSEAQGVVHRFVTDRFAKGLHGPAANVVGLLLARFLLALPLKAVRMRDEALLHALRVCWEQFEHDWDQSYAEECAALRRINPDLRTTFTAQLGEEAQRHELNDHAQRFALHLFLTVVRVVREHCDLEPLRSPPPEEVLVN